MIKTVTIELGNRLRRKVRHLRMAAERRVHFSSAAPKQDCRLSVSAKQFIDDPWHRLRGQGEWSAYLQLLQARIIFTNGKSALEEKSKVVKRVHPSIGRIANVRCRVPRVVTVSVSSS